MSSGKIFKILHWVGWIHMSEIYSYLPVKFLSNYAGNLSVIERLTWTAWNFQADISRLIIWKDLNRLMFLFSIAGNAWGGENLGRFLIWGYQMIDWLILVCDTKAPGCSKLCTNEFFPFSPIALWKLQMLGVSLPIIIFVSYSEPFQV